MKFNKIKSITYCEQERDVYDIQVEDTASYVLESGMVSHNSGFIYASSIVVATKKLKLKENEEGQKITEVDGVKAACKIMKSRYGKAFETCKLNIRFDKGLEPYSGLFDYWERLGVLTKVGNRYKYICNDGSEILEFRKNLTADHFQRIMEEWDYNKFKLKSDARLNNTEEELSEEELHKISDDFLNSEDTTEAVTED